MNPQAAKKYLQTKVMTATAEQLQMMLFDGAVQSCEQACAALEKDYERSFQSLSRAQAIVNQLIRALKVDIAPICAKSSGSFARSPIGAWWMPTCIIGSNRSTKALNVLKFQRETWAMLMQQLGKHKAAAAAATLDIPAPDARMEASISMEG